MNARTNLLKTPVSLCIAAVCAVAAISPLSGGQQAIEAGVRAKVVRTLADLVRDHYVDAQVGLRCRERLLRELREGAFSTHEDAGSLSSALRRSLRAESKDKHFTVRWRDPSAKRKPAPRRDAGRLYNYGFRHLQRFDGNVGYLKLTGFHDPAAAGEVAAASMTFLGHSDAVIIDLRNNGGGSARMVQMLATWFFDRPTELSGIWRRKGNRLNQAWTLPYVPGRRMPKVPLFILTSAYTFSAAEAFAFDMKVAGRAKIIGEVTGGGAHPGREMPICDGFRVWMPTGKAVNPKAPRNWEGVGVTPHTKVAAKDALAVAKRQAVKSLIDSASDPSRKQGLRWILEGLPSGSGGRPRLDEYAGAYNPESIVERDGVLHRSRNGQPSQELRWLHSDVFTLAANSSWRFRFSRDSRGRVVSLSRMHEDGERSTHARKP